MKAYVVESFHGPMRCIFITGDKAKAEELAKAAPGRTFKEVDSSELPKEARRRLEEVKWNYP